MAACSPLWRDRRRRRYAHASHACEEVPPMSAPAVKQHIPQQSQGIDFDKFRLRRFLDKLYEIGEVEVHEEPVALGDLSSVIEASAKATHFKRVGPEQFEMLAAVSGSRKRVAAAFGVGEREIAHEFMRRMANPQQVI